MKERDFAGIASRLGFEIKVFGTFLQEVVGHPLTHSRIKVNTSERSIEVYRLVADETKSGISDSQTPQGVIRRVETHISQEFRKIK